MLTLWLDSEKVVINEAGVKQILEKLPKATTNMFYQHLDGVRKRTSQRKFKRPGFKFVRQGYSHTVPTKHLPELKAACEQALVGDAEFQVGLRAISSSMAKADGVVSPQ
jgi:hypothetical protein